MRLAIRHISRYHIDEQAAYAMQRLRLRPQSGPCQTVRAWQVTIDGVEPTLGYTDGLGNRVDLVRHERGRAEVVIVAAGVVETEDHAGIFGEADPYAAPWLFERETPLTRAGSAVRELAAALPAEHGCLDALHWLMGQVHTQIRHVPAAHADEPAQADAALVRGEGSSRDHTHAFVAAARALRIPARYVCGYVLTDGSLERMTEAIRQAGAAQPSQQSQQLQMDSAGMLQSQSAAGAARQTSVQTGTLASAQVSAQANPQASAQTHTLAATLPPCGHAWAEAFVDGLGWVGFDPFLNRCPDERYVRIAVGLDHRDTQSVSGIGAWASGVEISVAQAPELI
ncbi:transglutaminase family protein [Paraburkholderia sp. J63]|uniref:transglutaminase family protein n=1 Tax=Paraburkholderia sp. J63 TaxID=2805434 RepID=UPI002ABE31C9|nr:transglutaminase family protein [Paraburkholderia sp. J63]